MIQFFATTGTMYLSYLTYQDIKNNMLVDDRFNYLMLGIGVAMAHFYFKNIWFTLCLILVLFLLRKYMERVKVFGKADINTINWVFLGFAVYDVKVLIIFTLVFLILTSLYLFAKHKLYKITSKTPFYPVLLSSFILSCAIFNLYGLF